MILHRYWITFHRDSTPSYLNIGCGVTATTIEEATEMLRVQVFDGAHVPPFASVQVDVDVSTLDAKHVIPKSALPSPSAIRR